MSYDFDQIPFGQTDTSSATVPDFDKIEFGGVVYVEPETETVPLNGFGITIRWGKLRRMDGGTKLPWGKRPYRDRLVRVRYEDTPSRLHTVVSIRWQSTNPCDPVALTARWRDASPLNGYHLTSPWQSPPRRDRSREIGWEIAQGTDRTVESPWVNRCVYHDFSSALRWQHPHRTDDRVVVPWINSLHYRDVLHRTYWGKELYDRICLQDYDPPAGNALHFDCTTKITQTNDGDHLNFEFTRDTYDKRCSQQEPSGWRDNYIYVAPATWPITPKYTVWYFMNSASMIRVSDSANVPFLGMTVRADIESWCWSFTGRISASSLEMVSPVDDPVEVLVTINGWSWRIMIESWTESRSFGRDEYTISGRSISAELAAPYAPIITGTNTAQLTSVQVAEERLENTGWTIDFSVFDSWLVSAGALSYNNSSALKVVQMVVEATGGRVLTDRSNSQLTVVKRLHSLPWNWDSETPDLSISDYVVRQLSREFLPGISYNAVFVSGENQGVLCKVTRSGTAGDEVAPMVTDALLTDTTPCSERGKLIIGRSGKWSRERLELPLTASSDLPGLLTIGMLVNMTEGTTDWRGQVVDIDVSAQWTKNKGLQVAQNIGVERYRGN